MGSHKPNYISEFEYYSGLDNKWSFQVNRLAFSPSLSNNCVFFLSAGSCLASELSFLLEPSDVIAVRERPLMLDCLVQGEEPIMVTWRKNGVPLPTSPRVRVLANGTLFIQSFQKRRQGSDADMGEYDCAAQNRYGMLVSRKAKVLLACKCLQHS